MPASYHRAPDRYHTATPSSPLGSVPDSDDNKADVARRLTKPRPQALQTLPVDGEDVQRISASLTRVLERLEAIQSKYASSQLVDDASVPLSCRELVLLHALLDCDPPFASQSPLTPLECAAIRRLQTHKQLLSLGLWFSRCRSDFYDNRLVVRMPSSIHVGVTNHLAAYLHHRFHAKLKEAGRADYVMMLRHGNANLDFKRSKFEPDVGLWLDFEFGYIGDDSDQEQQAQEPARAPQPVGNPAQGQEGQVSAHAHEGTAAADTTPSTGGPTASLAEEALPKTSKWPAIVLEVGWSHPTADKICTDYIKKGGGSIRCVLRINMEYIRLKDEHKFERPKRTILDGWRLHQDGPDHEPIRFLHAVDIYASPDNAKVEITLNDLHPTLPNKPVSLSLSRIAALVDGAFQRQKRDRDEDSGAEEAEGAGSRWPKRLRVPAA